MRDFKIVNGDISFWKNDIAVADGKQEVAQCIGTALGTNLGEFELEPETGIEFFSILGKGITEEDVQSEIFGGIVQEERVETVDTIDVVIDAVGRAVDVHFTVTTTDQDVVESEADFIA